MEANPESVTVLDLRTLRNVLSSVESKWYDIGLQLNIQPSRLRTFEADYRNCGRVFSETLLFWLGGNTSVPVSWNSIINALNSPSVNERGLASQIQATYCQLSGRESFPVPDGSNELDHPTNHPSHSGMTEDVAGISESSFPLLDEVTSLTQQEKKLLEAKLRYETREIIKKFWNLFNTFRQSLQDRNFPFKNLISHLKVLEAYDPIKDVPPEQQESVFEEHMRQLMNASSIDDVLDVVEKYCSFFNYDIIKCMIEKYGTDNDKLEMQKYIKEFIEYAKRRIYECPSKLTKGTESEESGRLQLKLDSRYNEKNLKALEDFQISLCKILGVSVNALLLCRLSAGCIELTYQIPTFIQRDAFPPSSEKEAALFDLGVLSLSAGAYCFSTSEHQRPRFKHSEEPKAAKLIQDVPQDAPNVQRISAKKKKQLTILESYSEDDFSDVHNLKVKCNNWREGCEWIGQLFRLKDHLLQCSQEQSSPVFNKQQTSHSNTSKKPAVHPAPQPAVSNSSPGLHTIHKPCKQEIPPFHLVMTNVSEYRQGKIWMSQSFLSHQLGYRLCLAVLISSDGKIHIGVTLAKGQQHPFLEFPCMGKILIKILHPTHTNMVLEVEVTFKLDATTSGAHFMPVLTSECDFSEQLITKNCLFFQVSKINMDFSCRPWLLGPSYTAECGLCKALTKKV